MAKKVARKLRKPTNLRQTAKQLSTAMSQVSIGVGNLVTEASALSEIRDELLEHADDTDRHIHQIHCRTAALTSQIPSIQKELASIRDRLAILERMPINV
jgi:chaperonin cofactor prefoldin